jgi:type I restriction enzyme S subunit
MVYITPEQNETIKNSTLHPGDILFAKTGATIGKTAIVPPSIAIANTTSHVGKITVDLTCFYPKYIYYALSSEVGNHQLWEIAGKKATRPEVGLDEVKYLKLLIPFSLDEQKQIADYLDAILDKCDTAINQHTQIISKLEEYKKSLIYNAVTGKIDCREGA